MRHVYACHLKLRGAPGDVLPAARAIVRAGAFRPFGGWPDGAPREAGSWAPSDGTRLRWFALDEPGVGSLFQVTTEQPMANDPTMCHVERVMVGAVGNRPFAFAQLSLTSTSTALTGSVAYDVEPPAVVVALVGRLDARDAGRQLVAHPAEAGTAELSRLITDPKRTRPVVGVTASAGGDGLDAGRLAARLAGLAHTVRIDRAAAAELAEILGGAEHAPANGSVMVWWPHWHPSDALGHQRHWHLWDASARGPEADILRTVYAASAFRLPAPALEGRLRSAAHRRRIGELEQQLDVGDRLLTDDVLEALDADLVELDELRARVREQDDELRRLRRETELLRRIKGVGGDAAVAAPTPCTPPATLVEALERVDATCERLVVLPKAIESARKREFPRVEEIFDDLVRLDAVAERWAAGALHDTFAKACEEAGLPWVPDISETAKTRHTHAYTRSYEGGDVLLGPHLRYGGGSASHANVVRVYCWLDRERHRVVIGHAGDHLPDSRTK